MKEWKSISKIEASQITDSWQKKDKSSFDEMVMNWNSIISSELDEEYLSLRKKVIAAFDEICSKIESDPVLKSRKDYNLDLYFGCRLYEILAEYGFSKRIGSNDQVWMYLCVKVFPDIVHKRYPGSKKKHEDGIIEYLNVNVERFWQTRRRIYLKVLWWYIYLSLQLDENAEPDMDRTIAVLKNNSTDEIVQIVERSGAYGYRVDLYRKLMKYYSDHRAKMKKPAERFRQVMVLNTARGKVIEPALAEDGIDGYVKELFEYFER